jgi:hypothetical protein
LLTADTIMIERERRGKNINLKNGESTAFTFRTAE